MNDIKITAVKIEQIGKKRWVRVYFDNGTSWIPSNAEQGLILNKVVECEKLKYPEVKDSSELPISFMVASGKSTDMIETVKYFELQFDKSGKERGSYKRFKAIVEASK